MSGIKPCGIVLNGYSFEVVDPNKTSYKMTANCSDGDAVVGEINIPEGYVLSDPSPNPIFFRVLGQGTNLNAGGTTITITQTATGAVYTVNIGQAGDIK